MSSEPILDLAAARVFADGSSGAIRLDHPEGVAVHPDGSVWCGGEAGQVYRIPPDGSSVELRVSDERRASRSRSPSGPTASSTTSTAPAERSCASIRRPAIPKRWRSESIGGHELVIPNALAFDRAGSLYITES